MRPLPALLATALLPACIPPGVEDAPPQYYPPPRATTPTAARPVAAPPRAPLPAAQPTWEPQRFDEGVVGVANPRPVWEARPVIADARTVPASDHVVRAGDSLRAIAARASMGVEAIAAANGLAPAQPLVAGQRLVLPGGRYHLVREGESGIAIARAYGVDWSRVVTANGLAEPFVLRVGQRILIPGGIAPRSAAAERAAAFRLDIEDLLTGAEPAIAATQRPVRPAPAANRVLAPTQAVAAPRALRGGFDWPLRGQLTSRFGRGPAGSAQNGITIAVPLDTPIRASADGTVVYAGTGVAGLGGLVLVKHGDGWTSVYGHAGRLQVQRGQAVKRGQVVALSGDSGTADRGQLHFELRKGRVAVDPLSQLPR